MIFFKVRRKKDGLFARTGDRCWGVGQTYSERSFIPALNLYNRVGRYNGIDGSYETIDLVKFDSDGGEIIIWTDSKCSLTNEQVKLLLPIKPVAPLVFDEIGPLLHSIELAKEALKAGQSFDLNNLFSKIISQDTRLRALLNSLDEQTGQLKECLTRAFYR